MLSVTPILLLQQKIAPRSSTQQKLPESTSSSFTDLKKILITYFDSFWSRCVKDCGPGAQARFKETMGLFFAAVNIEAKARDSNKIPDLESYIKVNRDTSGK